MAFRRSTEPAIPDRSDLTAAMIGIGMLFGGTPLPSPNIEDTILATSVEGMDRGDLRVLSVLTTWIGIHAPYVNVDRLTKIVAGASPRVRAYWSSVAAGRPADRRFRRLAVAYTGPRLELLRVGNDTQLRRKGADTRFAAGPVVVPAGTLRDRVADVMTPDELAARHDAYRWRVIIGPSYRADVWAALEADPKAKPADLARRTYASFATAWTARRDHRVVAGGGIRALSGATATAGTRAVRRRTTSARSSGGLFLRMATPIPQALRAE